MVSILSNHIAQEGTGQPFIGVVHRLDQPVEGVMVFAKTKQAAAKLSAQMKDHSFGKNIMPEYSLRKEKLCGSYRSCHRGNAAGLDAV